VRLASTGGELARSTTASGPGRSRRNTSWRAVRCRRDLRRCFIDDDLIGTCGIYSNTPWTSCSTMRSGRDTLWLHVDLWDASEIRARFTRPKRMTRMENIPVRQPARANTSRTTPAIAELRRTIRMLGAPPRSRRRRPSRPCGAWLGRGCEHAIRHRPPGDEGAAGETRFRDIDFSRAAVKRALAAAWPDARRRCGTEAGLNSFADHLGMRVHTRRRTRRRPNAMEPCGIPRTKYANGICHAAHESAYPPGRIDSSIANI